MANQSEVICTLSNGAFKRPLIPDFNGAPLFDVEYLRNGTR